MNFFSELVEAMQDKDAGVTLETHHIQDNKSYKLCFSGKYCQLNGGSRLTQQKYNFGSFVHLLMKPLKV